MTARYSVGTCPNCGGRIIEGQEIQKAGDRVYAHATCPTSGTVSTLTPQQAPEQKTVREPDAPATPKQRDLVAKLAAERAVPEDLDIPAADDELTRGEASAIIDRLFASGTSAAPKELPSVPRGRYAIEVELRGEIYNMIVRVWRGDRNPKVVRVYNDDTGQEITDKADALRRIEEYGVAKAAVRYGQLRGKCYRCNAKLLKRISIEMGVGEHVCAEHLYGKEGAKARRAAARETIRARGEDPEEAAHALEEPEQLELRVA